MPHTSGASGPSVILKQLSNRDCAKSSAESSLDKSGHGYVSSSGTNTTPTISSLVACG